MKQYVHTGEWDASRIQERVFKLFSAYEPAREVENPTRGDPDYDFDAADAAMRNKLGDPECERPNDYIWHHKEDGVTM